MYRSTWFSLMLFVVEYSALFAGSLRIRLFFQYRIKPPSPVDGNVAIDVEQTEISRGDVILQFDGEWKDQNLFVIQNLTCFRNRFVQPPCKDIEKELTLIVFREPTNERTAFRVTGRDAYIYHHLQLWIRAEQTFGELNLTCTLISYTTPPRPTFPNPYAPSKISLFSVIFLTACVILIVGLSLVWLMNMYYRRYRHYREKKKLLEALARTTQEVLNKAPILTYNPNDPTLNYDDPTCAICLETFQAEDQLRQLICKHLFHVKCVDPWLLTRQQCPLCNRNILRNSIPSISSNIIMGTDDSIPHRIYPSAPEENSPL